MEELLARGTFKRGGLWPRGSLGAESYEAYHDHECQNEDWQRIRTKIGFKGNNL